MQRFMGSSDLPQFMVPLICTISKRWGVAQLGLPSVQHIGQASGRSYYKDEKTGCSFQALSIMPRKAEVNVALEQATYCQQVCVLATLQG